MKIKIVTTRPFDKELKVLFRKRQLSKSDFQEFLDMLAENPHDGDAIIGTGGVRKSRMKSVNKGKSGGFRVCYYYDDDFIMLLLLYAKNWQEDITEAQRQYLKGITDERKKSKKK